MYLFLVFMCYSYTISLPALFSAVAIQCINILYLPLLAVVVTGESAFPPQDSSFSRIQDKKAGVLNILPSRCRAWFVL